MVLKKNKKTGELSATVLQERFRHMSDFYQRSLITKFDQTYLLFFLQSLIDTESLNRFIILPLLDGIENGVVQNISSVELEPVTLLKEAEQKILAGCVLIIDNQTNQFWLAKIPNLISRSIETSQQENILYGPKDSFTELVDQNITLIRRRLPLAQLKSELFTIGSLSKTKVLLIYLEGIIDPALVETAREKIKLIDYDIFLNTPELASFLEENKNSVFPQSQISDRPDATASALASGKVAILMDGTPFALIAPITFFELFQSPQDYIHRWPVATFLRALRFFAFFIVLSLTPAYVAISTYHYEMIPLQILVIITGSRSEIPLTPFWEALSMMLTVEILKEASLRMPTKTAQTLGIVGGIVIGQAAVQSGLTSNTMVVSVAISSIASFLVPNYLMTSSSKLLQYIFLGLAAIWGFLGIIIGFTWMCIHLNSLSSLNRSYIAPLSPWYTGDWKDTLVRLPIQSLKTRPEYLKTLRDQRFECSQGDKT